MVNGLLHWSIDVAPSSSPFEPVAVLVNFPSGHFAQLAAPSCELYPQMQQNAILRNEDKFKKMRMVDQMH